MAVQYRERYIEPAACQLAYFPVLYFRRSEILTAPALPVMLLGTLTAKQKRNIRRARRAAESALEQMNAARPMEGCK